MIQTALVTKTYKDGTADITVTRKSACAGDCENCHGCIHPEEKVTVRAENPVSAVCGDKVTVSTESKRIIGAAALFYLLPVAFMIIGYLLFDISEGLKILSSVAGLAIGIAISAVVYSKKKIDYRITEILR